MASSYLSRSLLAIIGSLFAAVAIFTHNVSTGIVSAFNAAVHFFDFRPTGDDALALDRLSHELAVPDKRYSPFKAFIERAETHSLFSAGGFHIDPGRATA